MQIQRLFRLSRIEIGRQGAGLMIKGFAKAPDRPNGVELQSSTLGDCGGTTPDFGFDRASMVPIWGS